VRTRPVPSTARRRHRRFAAALALIGIGLLAAGIVGVAGKRGTPQLDTRSQDRRLLPVPGPHAITHALPVEHRPRKPAIRKQLPRPARIVIPAIGVSAPVVPLGLNADHTLQVPTTFSDAGWFEPGPEPGEVGSALIVGHVDSHDGPGVFYRLRALRRGDRITVVLATGRRLAFVVTSSRDVAKLSFPTSLVYRRTSRPTLRLVTCGGRFDQATHHYLSNHIVFAWLLGQP
jgi:sortase (surface protein transpeptidase)